MTIAEVSVNLYLALPQGWTQEEVQDRVNDLLISLAERDTTMVEFDIHQTRVNADPFGNEFQAKVAANFAQAVPTKNAGLLFGGPRPLAIR